MRSSVTFTLSLSLLVMWMLGCATPRPPQVWSKPGGSQEELAKVKYKCLQESQQEVSKAASNGYAAKSSSHAITNHLLFTSCMNAQGWFLAYVNETTPAAYAPPVNASGGPK